MAPKRPSLLDQPPPSVSTSEDEVEGTEGEEEDEEEVEGVKQEEEESEEEESGEEEEEEEIDEKTPKPIQSSHKNPNPNNKANEDGDIAEDDDDDDEEENDESGSDSGSDSDNEPVKHMIAPRNVDVKPISSKPMVDIPKSKKPTSTSSAAVKRPLETDSNDKDSKRDKKKKKIADIEEKDTENKSGEEKKLFQRIFSEKDEIDVLNGLLEFKKKGNRITNSGLSEFFDFLKGSVHVGANLNQITNKVQRLHKKYRKNVKRAKPGGDPTISNPHGLKSYLLSKEIWGDQIFKDGEENQSGVTAGKKSKSKPKSNGVASPTPKKKLLVLPAISPKVEPMEEDNVIGSHYQYLDQSLKSQNHLSLPMPPADFGEITAKDGWDKLGSLKAQAFDQRWKALIIKETEVYLERVELVQEQTKWMLDMHKSSDS
ncbi:hypothetical protein AQUCO_00900897v1 [Aquilegia coerulea]|uniref:Glabrous enhancer-binding protein-like DBD domain-containing protein n=1 Tax=Aquilegia coerulea TaxID=218851 RepID=A0A2G5EGD6_AQUCA|nr:hypothetical protein AQUCO_00900897v1 [Aquilegia coerulea]